ncbi:MAG: Tim44 domain-containing protein [Telmatospirillum sp.]|nr:Tim44 domain-containing protein [Telmatospirillum sp.]
MNKVGVVSRKWTKALVVSLALGLALLPALAEAKAGGGSSMGSRGSRTYTPNTGAPVQRSLTPPPAAQPSAPPMAAQPAPGLRSEAPAMAPQASMARRNPLMTGMMAGFLGAGLGALIFGGHGFAGGGLGGVLSLVLQGLLLFFVVRWAMRLFAGRGRPDFAGAAPQSPPGPAPAPAPAHGQARQPQEFPLTQEDLSSFERILTGIQAAWSRNDVDGLRHLVTPEMAGYMAEQLAGNAARGLSNQVQQVRLLQGDVNETWREGGAEYATVTMRWEAGDFMVRIDNGAGAAGDPRSPVATTEVWTLVRQRNGGWLLSAIQQG